MAIFLVMVNQQRTSEGPGIKGDDRKRHKAPDLFQERTIFFLFFTAAHILFFLASRDSIASRT